MIMNSPNASSIPTITYFIPYNPLCNGNRGMSLIFFIIFYKTLQTSIKLIIEVLKVHLVHPL